MSDKRRYTRRFDLKRPLLSIAALATVALLLGLAESGARLIAPERCHERDERARALAFALKFLQPCYTREQRGGETWLVGTAGSGPGEPNAMPLRKVPGTLRIAVVGESSAHLLAQTLERAAAARTCGPRYEILKCGLPGASREHVERRFDEALGYAPDVVLFAFGHNVMFEMPTDEARLRTESQAAWSCLLSWSAPPAPAPGSGGGDDPLAPRLAGLEAFLRRAARATRERHVALVVATMAANLWLPPAEARLAPDDPRELEARYLEATSRPAEALAALAGAGQAPSLYPRFHRAELLARAGDREAAYRELHRALDDDGRRTRAPTRVNELIRRVAAEEALPLRDTERALEAAAPMGLPGWESFIDNVHLRVAARGRESREMLALARAALGVPADDPCDPTDPAAGAQDDLGDVYRGVLGLVGGSDRIDEVRWLRGLSFAVESWARADPAGVERATAAFLAGPELARASAEVRGRFLESVSEGYLLAGREDEALRLNARARDGEDAGAWVQLGLLRLRAGDAAQAREAFTRASALDGGRRDAGYFLERMKRDAGG